MTNQQIINKLQTIKKGQYVSLTKIKDLGKGASKVSDMVIRLGVDFANMKVNEGRESIGSLPWGNWVNGLEGLVIEHKGNYYLRVASSYANNAKTTYYINNEEVSKEAVEELIGVKKLEGKASDVYNIKFENILALGN